MATADPSTVITCPSCGVRFAVSPSMAGRRGRCTACDAAFIVPAPAVKPEDEPPQHIGVECRVCGTRMYGRLDQVGKQIKCPDCGAKSVVPPPPKPKPKNMPAALEGEQYELWDVDAQPLPSDLLAIQPKYIAVQCRKCASLMYANEIQVGQQIACPDCGTKHIVPPSPKKKSKPSVLTPDRQTPQLDPAAAPGERPSYAPYASGMTYSEEVQAAEYARALEKSQRTGKPMELDVRGRPVLPRFPLLSGILPFPFYSGCLERWLLLSIGLLLASLLLLGGVHTWVVWTPRGYDFEGGMQALAGLIETLFGAVFAIIWLAAASNVFIAIVSQTAVGTNRISDWPQMNFISSLAEMLPVSVAVVFTAAPGWMLGELLGSEWWLLGLLALGSVLLGFPITLLSQLAGSSTWELIDLKVLGAAVRSPFSMMLFYVQSTCLAAMCLTATVALAQVNVFWPLALAPLYVVCMFWYARLLGRLAWRLSEKISADDPAGDEQPKPAAKNYNPPR